MAPDAEMIFEYDKDVIGKEVEVGSAEITPERVALYMKATGETNPLYTDEPAAKAGPYGSLLARQSEYYPTAYRPPALPVMLSVIYAVAGRNFAVWRIVNCAIVAGAVTLAAAISAHCSL